MTKKSTSQEISSFTLRKKYYLLIKINGVECNLFIYLQNCSTKKQVFNAFSHFFPVPKNFSYKEVNTGKNVYNYVNWTELS